MTDFFQSHTFIVMTVLVLLTLLLLFQGLFMLWTTYKGPAARKIEKRLQALGAVSDASLQTQLLKDRLLSDVPAFERLLLSIPRAKGLDRFILQAGLEWKVSRLILGCLALGAAALALMVVVLRQPLLLGLAVGAVTGSLPMLYVSRRRSKRLTRLETQLPDALDLVVRALRSGHSFSSALQMIGDEMADPVAAEFRTVHDEVNFGVSLQQALTNLSERVPLTDLRYFVVSVLIQRDSGGNLTEVLTNLSRLIRERLKLISRVRVLSTEGRLSAWIIGVMPFVLALLMFWANPEFIVPLWTDPIGVTIVKYLLILMAIGAFVMSRIVKIRF
ncbi:MAG: type II secretion system F family protein [Pseudomonadota bacterium]